MGSMTTFGAFTSARLGMYASMKGLDVTGHNISNINTRGYSRQVLDQESLRLNSRDKYVSYNDARVGTGVLCTGISQIRDPYLDIRYRNESSKVGSLDTKLSGLDDIRAKLDEVGKSGGDGLIEKQLNDMFEKLSVLNGAASTPENQRLVRASAESLVSLLNSYATSLESSSGSQKVSYKQDITKANSIMKDIAELNDSIRKSEIHGDSALELRDRRNVLIDDLSKYMKVNVSYRANNIGAGVVVQDLIITLGDSVSGGPTLVDGTYATELSIHTDPVKNTAFDTTRPNGPGNPEWLKPDGTATDILADAAQIEDPNLTLDLAVLVDSKGRPLAGSTAGTMPTTNQGALQAAREMLTCAGEFTPNGTAADLTKRGIPYYQKSMDALANKFAKVFNDTNPAWVSDKDGYFVDKDGNRLVDPNDNTAFLMLKDEAIFNPAQKAVLEGSGVSTGGGTLFSNSNAGNDATGITAKNISISRGWSSNSTQLATFAYVGDDQGSTANVNIGRMMTLMKGKQTYAPSDIMGTNGSSTSYCTGSFQDYYTNMSAVLGNDISTTSTILNSYAGTAQELDINRSSASGVDLNDEAANMMMYQKSYSAAARLMTTIDEALDKLINGTGVVGR